MVDACGAAVRKFPQFFALLHGVVTSEALDPGECSEALVGPGLKLALGDEDVMWPLSVMPIVSIVLRLTFSVDWFGLDDLGAGSALVANATQYFVPAGWSDTEGVQSESQNENIASFRASVQFYRSMEGATGCYGPDTARLISVKVFKYDTSKMADYVERAESTLDFFDATPFFDKEDTLEDTARCPLVTELRKLDVAALVAQFDSALGALAVAPFSSTELVSGIGAAVYLSHAHPSERPTSILAIGGAIRPQVSPALTLELPDFRYPCYGYGPFLPWPVYLSVSKPAGAPTNAVWADVGVLRVSLHVGTLAAGTVANLEPLETACNGESLPVIPDAWRELLSIATSQQTFASVATLTPPLRLGASSSGPAFYLETIFSRLGFGSGEVSGALA